MDGCAAGDGALLGEAKGSGAGGGGSDPAAAGATRITPFIHGCGVQWNRIVAGRSKLNRNVAPGASDPDSNEPSSAVTVWICVPPLRHTTLSRARMLSDDGRQPQSSGAAGSGSTATIENVAGALPAREGCSTTTGVALGVGCFGGGGRGAAPPTRITPVIHGCGVQ